ncbi:sialate O-acetylesterase [Novosphingobium subterraneum]|uniref:sialate O-acetylesterase n=1 Tax=Novosphingobium subterraneum TaxID=48936 RepID=UPI003D092BF2
MISNVNDPCNGATDYVIPVLGEAYNVVKQVQSNLAAIQAASENIQAIIDATPAAAASAQAWAEGTLPGGIGTKSSKEWSAEAASNSATAAVLAYLASNPFANTTALYAYSNAALAVGMSTTIVGDGRYEVASLGPVVWTRTADDGAGRAEAAADSAVQAAQDAEVSADSAEADRIAAEAAQAAAESARAGASAAVAASQDYFPGARSHVPQGAVTGAATISTAGTGGTNGTFDLAFSGGNFAVNPTGTFTVSGGAVTAITITGPGLYIGNAISKPTLSFAASAGLTGAAGTFNTVYLKTAGQYWLTDTSPASAYLALFQNQANVAVEIDDQFDPMSAGAAADAVADMRDAVGTIASNAAAYGGSGPLYPLMTDAKGNFLLGFDEDAREVVGRGVIPSSRLLPLISAGFAGDSGMVPLMTDAAGNVLFGYDLTTFRGFVHGVSDAPQPCVKTIVETPPITKAINHILAYGQSLAVGANSGALVSTSQPFSNITFIGGPRAWTGSASAFAPFKPLVEDSVNPAPDGNTGRGETPCSGAANYASVIAAEEFGADPSANVILASTAGHGGWKISQLEKGQAWYSGQLLRHVEEAFDLNPNYACHLIDWIQGENDGLDQTSLATYRDKLNQLVLDVDADIRAIAINQQSPVYFSISVTAGYAGSWGQVQLAQREVARSNPLAFIACPLYPFMNQQNTDGLHLTSATMVWRSAFVGRAAARLMHGGEAPRWLDVVSATLRGNRIRVRLDVPVRPLALDTITVGETKDYGFAVEDTTGVLNISSIFIDGDDVVIDLATTPTGSTEVRYALDYLGTNMTITNGATGNICDSAPETVTVNGTVRPLKNFLIPFAIPVINLGA